MDKRKKALLMGLVLGDGHLNSNSGVALEIEHGHKQEFYVKYKVNLIAKLLNGSPPKIYHNKKKDTYKISKGHRYFRIIKNMLYKNKKKRFSKKVLNLLNPEAIAI